MKEEILKLHSTGKYTDKQIADIVGCSRVNVGYHLNKNIKNRILKRIKRDRTETITSLKMKAGGKCCVCNYDKCLKALDFHHVGQKRMAVSKAISHLSKANLDLEVSRCVLICCRCHRELHEGLITL